jgi:hypothetical protein
MTAPKYNPNVPQQPDSALSVTQKPLQDNFQVLFDVFKVNHVPLDSVSDIGNHSLVQLLQQVNPIETQFGEINAYTKEAKAQTDQVYLRYQGNGQEFQYTNYQLYTLEPVDNPTNFFTFLPGRILVYFGVYVQSGSVGSKKRKYLTLRPAVAVNIISVNYCPISTTPPTLIPTAFVQTAVDGFFTQIDLALNDKQSAYYLVTANI